jgi:hypothetical protein
MKEGSAGKQAGCISHAAAAAAAATNNKSQKLTA